MLEKIKDKYVFFDLDGTLSEYRFNDHVSGRNGYGVKLSRNYSLGMFS